jgi:PiT family inorganic phosphate transporter
MVVDSGEKLSRFDRVQLEAALTAVFDSVRGENQARSPKLSDLAKYCLSHSDESLKRIGKMLFPWTGKTPYGKLLDGAGAVVAKAGTGSLIAGGILKTVTFIVVSPLLGFVLGSLMMVIVAWIFRGQRPLRVDKWFRRLQLVSAGAYSLGHGGNDAQKTIGIIWMLLIATGYASTADKSPPIWAIVSCYAAIGLGTMFGGWRIVKTMGQRITKLKPVGGFCAETGGAMTLFLASILGVPVSTTHTITGAIVGVGSTRNVNSVRWGVAGNIVWAWIFTIPASAAVAAGCYALSLALF